MRRSSMLEDFLRWVRCRWFTWSSSNRCHAANRRSSRHAGHMGGAGFGQKCDWLMMMSIFQNSKKVLAQTRGWWWWWWWWLIFQNRMSLSKNQGWKSTQRPLRGCWLPFFSGHVTHVLITVWDTSYLCFLVRSKVLKSGQSGSEPKIVRPGYVLFFA